MLGQTETSNLLVQCNGDSQAIEEVLSAYVAWKFMKGRTHNHILGKLRTLRLYLQVTGHRDVLESGRQAFLVYTALLSLPGAESLIGVLPTMTPIGRDVWNRLRRTKLMQNKAKNQRNLGTDREYGGPGSSQSAARGLELEGDEEATRREYVIRHFRSKPQFGNLGVPAYRVDIDTLPMYISALLGSTHQASVPAVSVEES